MATVKGDVHDIGKNIVGVVLQCNNYEVIDLGVMVSATKILETAKAEKADIIGLSGLITPSLDEMCHVAAEMEREGFALPLLIGGATTSRVHTAVKIHPNYRRGQTIYVTDASRAVGVVSQLMSRQLERRLCGRGARGVRQDRGRACARRGEQAAALDRRTRAECARSSTGRATCRRQPSFLGTRVFDDYSVAELIDYIDWSPFFSTWELTGKFPAILDDDKFGAGGALALRRRAGDAATRSSRRTGSRAAAIVGFWPANAVGDDIEVAADERATCSTPCASNWRGARAAPMWRSPTSSRRRSSGRQDHIGAFVVTAGIGEDVIADRFKHANDDYSSIMVKALADRLAEAFAERMHQRVRKEFWGYAADETFASARADRGEISRHPSGAGLSGATRPHREGDAVRPDRRRADRREADRKLRDVAGRLGVRALFQPPGGALFRRRQDRARPGRGLCGAQGLERRARPSAGSRRCSTTIRSASRARRRNNQPSPRE